MIDYLNNLGVKGEMHKDLLASIRPIVVGTPTPTNNIGNGEAEEITVAKVKAAFQDPNDLIALSRSLEQQKLKKKSQKFNKKKLQQRPKRKVVVSFPSSADSSFTTTLTWKYGESMLDLFRTFPGQQALQEGQQHRDESDNSITVSDIMEGACGGHCSCSTCHIYLDPNTFEALEAPTEAELDMLDLAFEVRETSSRLGCQVKSNHLLEKKLSLEHEIVVSLPSGVNNHWES